MQSGRCRECMSLGKWPEVVAAALALVIFVFLFFFSWFPLLPEWVQSKLSFFTDKIEEKATEKAQEGKGEREEFGAAEEKEDQDDTCNIEATTAQGQLNMWSMRQCGVSRPVDLLI
jgi:hypothetical protein